MTRVLALDIETVSTDTDTDSVTLDFLNSREFQLLGIGLGLGSLEDGCSELDVLFREGIDPQSEVQLLERISEWIQRRRPIETIITYNGTGFDFRHLRGRARILADEAEGGHLPAELDQHLSPPSHRDLFLEYQRAHDYRCSFEDALAEYGVDVPAPVYWNDAKVTNTRIPELGREYLCGKAGLDNDAPIDSLEDVLTKYTRRDVAPLFELAEALLRDRS